MLKKPQYFRRLWITAILTLLIGACDVFKNDSVHDPEPDLGLTLREASAIVLKGDHLLMVSDDTPAILYRYKLKPEDHPNSEGPLLASISIEPTFSRHLVNKKAKDLEGIDLLSNGELVLLSEQAYALFTPKGLVAQYPKFMSEVAGRGLEGLAINAEDQVAVLWEGGYYSPKLLSSLLVKSETNQAQIPFVCIHQYSSELNTLHCDKGEGVVKLNVPATPLRTQAFRAPDLEWSEDNNSLIVLLASQNLEDTAFKYMWLQRFSLSGEAIGAALNLCDRGFLPKHLRSGRASNFEGLAWFEPGKSLMLVNDYSNTATAVIISVEPWPETDLSIACDQALL